MKYDISPELRGVAKRVPYNKLMIKLADIFLPRALPSLPGNVSGRSIYIAGHKGMRFRTDIFEPKGAKGLLPCLIYAHGGAFTYRASPYHKKLAYTYAAGAGCRVFFPDYHLAPKYPYPAAYDDILSLYRYIIDNAEELRADTEHIAMAGDSAGGCLAALICCNYQREKLPRPCAQMLVYPLTDCNMDTESMRRYTDTPLWNAVSNSKMWAYFCANEEDRLAASPMHCPLPEIVPQAYIETAQFDCLHDEGVLYGARLREAGAKVTVNETKGTVHGYDSAINTKIAITNIEKRIDFLVDMFKKRS